MNSQKWIIGCGVIGGLLILILVVGAVMASLLIPEAQAQVPGSRNPIYVTINMPLNGSSLPLNQPASVFVRAFGNQNLQGIELLLDGVPLPNGSATPAGAKERIVSWAWTPDKAGIHTLLARASTQDGQTAVSHAVNIMVLPAEQIPPAPVQGSLTEPVVITEEPSLIEAGAGPGDAAAIPAPPGFNDQGGLVNVPPPFPAQPPGQVPPVEPAQQPGSSLVPAKYGLWWQNYFQTVVNTTLPAAPTLDGGTNQCEGILVVQDNASDELGFFIYRLNPGQTEFERVATLDGKTGKAVFSYHDLGLAAGNYSYYLSSFNSAGESASNVISLGVVAPQCATAILPGFGLFGNSIPVELDPAVGKAYCYGSASGMPWVRVPNGQNNFIQPINGKIDLAPYWNLIPLPQPTPAEVTLTMECWGWSGATLAYQGAFSQTFNASGGTAQPTQTLPPQPPGKNEKPQKNLLSSPFNVYLSNDPTICKDHASNAAEIAQCEVYQANAKGRFLLVWSYNRFGNCNPQAENCDMDLQPADAFRVYSVINGVTAANSIQPINFKNTYITAFNEQKNMEFFVRAVSYKLDPDGKGYESMDSNHALFPQPLEIMVIPTEFSTLGFIKSSNSQYWKDASVPSADFYSGYDFGCLFECSKGDFWDGYYHGYVIFNLPENLNVQSARLSWKNVSYQALGPGKQKVIGGCGISLQSTTFGWDYFIFLSNSMMWGTENYDVSLPVLQAIQDGEKTIQFMFFPPSNMPPSSDRWDRCMWFMKNATLTYQYYDQ